MEVAPSVAPAPRARMPSRRAVGGEARARRAVPGPGVAEPDRRQQVERRRLRAAVVDRDLDEDVLGRRLGVLDEDVEVAAVVEDAGVEQLVLGLGSIARRRFSSSRLRVRVLRLRVLVEVLQVGVRRRRVEVEPVLLDVLAVVALGVRQAEEALLQDRVLPVPEREGEADALVAVGDAQPSPSSFQR